MEQMNVQRILARAMVLVGGLMWVFMPWGAEWSYRGSPLNQALAGAAIYAAALAVLFVIGMFYEYAASAVLAVGIVAVVVFGLVSGWETGVWAIGVFFFILPMIAASVLYYLMARMQTICSR
jgi:hypothetical protein